MEGKENKENQVPNQLILVLMKGNSGLFTQPLPFGIFSLRQIFRCFRNFKRFDIPLVQIKGKYTQFP
jgi:hypothetical protein